MVRKKQFKRWQQQDQLRKWIDIIYILAWKNIKVRYKNSFLGIFWSLITPLIFLGIFVFIFSRAFSAIANYPLFALSGLIFWNFFATSTAQITGSIIEGRGILKSIPVPPILFPVASLLAALFNLLLSLIPFSGLMLLFGRRPSWHLMILIPIIGLYAGFILGISLLLTSLNVYMRDAGMLWSSILPGILYLTPIAYPVDLIPEDWQWFMNLNPLFHFIRSFREVLYYSRVPTSADWLLISMISLAFLSLGIVVFRKLQRNFISAL